MNWTEICIKVPTQQTEITSAIANMLVRGGIYIEDYCDLEKSAQEIAHIDLIDEELISRDRSHSVIHLYISEEENAAESLSFLNESLKNAGIDFQIVSNTVKDSDWADNWKKYFKTTRIGNRLIICPSWEECAPGPEDAVLKIDPGAAFGTGTHATTSLCLNLLERYIQGGEKVLDIGCGSGILSIASVLLGAESSVGVDIDPMAVKVADDNALINNVSDKTTFIVGDLAEKIKGRYNVVCANIVADVIIRLFADIKRYMEDNAVFIISGIIDSRADDVIAAAEKYGFKVVQEHRRDNWFAFVLMDNSEDINA